MFTKGSTKQYTIHNPRVRTFTSWQYCSFQLSSLRHINWFLFIYLFCTNWNASIDVKNLDITKIDIKWAILIKILPNFCFDNPTIYQPMHCVCVCVYICVCGGGEAIGRGLWYQGGPSPTLFAFKTHTTNNFGDHWVGVGWYLKVH